MTSSAVFFKDVPVWVQMDSAIKKSYTRFFPVTFLGVLSDLFRG